MRVRQTASAPGEFREILSTWKIQGKILENQGRAWWPPHQGNSGEFRANGPSTPHPAERGARQSAGATRHWHYPWRHGDRRWHSAHARGSSCRCRTRPGPCRVDSDREHERRGAGSRGDQLWPRRFDGAVGLARRTGSVPESPGDSANFSLSGFGKAEPLAAVTPSVPWWPASRRAKRIAAAARSRPAPRAPGSLPASSSACSRANPQAS